MKRNFSLKISVKLAVGFGVSLLIVLISYGIIYQMLIKNEKIAEFSGKNIVPSVAELNKFSLTILESKYLTKSWVLEEQSDNTPKKRKLKQITGTTYLQIKNKIQALSYSWNSKDKQDLQTVFNITDDLIIQEKELMKRLNSWESYDDPYFEQKFTPEVQEGNPLMVLADSAMILIENISNNKKEILLKANDEMDLSFRQFRSRVLLSGLVLTILIVFVGFVLAISLLKPINYLKNLVSQMGTGDLPSRKIKIGNDETGQMGTALNELIKGLREKAAFAGDIEKGNFDSNFKPISRQDVLGNSLLRMRDSLVQASQAAEIRRIENQQRSWAAQGIAEFNEIIREHNETLEDFTSVTISKLTKYLDSQVGGLYILNNENKNDVYLELAAFYAYDRQKFIERKIKLGENLVGQSVLEKDTIFMTDIPKDYVHISSGLGKDAPSSLLIVPLKLNEEIYGVVELASFNVFKPYQIEFVEKTGEILASTIANININLTTTKLLEESNEKSERLAKQEEESRKNIEKLESTLQEKKDTEDNQKSRFKKTEEEYRNQIQRLENRIESNIKTTEQFEENLNELSAVINNTLPVLEISVNGEILKANKLFLSLNNTALDSILGKNISDFIEESDFERDKYNAFRKKVEEGANGKLICKYNFANTVVTREENYIPVKAKDGKISKIFITYYPK